MHALPISEQPRIFGQTLNTNQSAISQPRRMANTRHTLHVSTRIFQIPVARKALPICTEETDKEAVTEKKRGGKIISASSLQHQVSASVQAANTPSVVFVWVTVMHNRQR